MGETKIEWTHQRNPDGTLTPGYTFNPWQGCQKVSVGCQHCYAETLMDQRFGRAKWGPVGPRVRTSDDNWRKPLAWNRKARAEGRRDRVFCASLADVFEDRHEVNAWRVALLEMIELTHALDWLLLTKRPENVKRLIEQAAGRSVESFLERNPHVWIGASVENQEQAEKRIPHLLAIPAALRFLSCEPLLGPVDLRPYLHDDQRIDWIIVGGESGPGARPMNPDWVRKIRDDCYEDEGAAFFFKQWGEWAEADSIDRTGLRRGRSELPFHEFPGPVVGSVELRALRPTVYRAGKRDAGRLLDGRTWDEVPSKGGNDKQ